MNGKGFVDPASEEYDLHLERDETGNIIGKTEAGQYMVQTGLQFDKRSMRDIYKAMMLIDKKE